MVKECKVVDRKPGKIVPVSEIKPRFINDEFVKVKRLYVDLKTKRVSPKVVVMATKFKCFGTTDDL